MANILLVLAAVSLVLMAADGIDFYSRHLKVFDGQVICQNCVNAVQRHPRTKMTIICPGALEKPIFTVTDAFGNFVFAVSDMNDDKMNVLGCFLRLLPPGDDPLCNRTVIRKVAAQPRGTGQLRSKPFLIRLTSLVNCPID